MSELRLFLLGPPRIERDGAPLELHRHKDIALLAYLALGGMNPGRERHTREALVTLLWPELEPSRARAGLRRNLSALGKNGLSNVAAQCYHKAHYAAEQINALDGFSVDMSQPFFKEFVVTCPGSVAELNNALLDHWGIIGGYDLGRDYEHLADHMLICVTEVITRQGRRPAYRRRMKDVRRAGRGQILGCHPGQHQSRSHFL